MAENLIIHTGSKEEKYRELLPQLHALVSTEADLIANLANMAAALKQNMQPMHLRMRCSLPSLAFFAHSASASWARPRAT